MAMAQGRAINGAAVGIGMTMQLPMDIRMASTTARFGFVFARRGITLQMLFTPNSTEQRTGLAAGRFEIAHAAVDNTVAMIEVAKADALLAREPVDA